MKESLRLAYLIFVHQNPVQLTRLLKRLENPNNTFYIYVDSKANLNEFRLAVRQTPVNNVVWLTKRHAVSWGDFSLSAAYLSAFQTILQQRPQPDFILTLSGQDYPIATNQTIQHWLVHHRDQTILDHSIITNQVPHLLERVQQYYLSVKRHHCIVYPHPKPDNLKRKLFDLAIQMSGRFPLPRRLPLNHQLYFGTNWFQLKPQAADYLVNFTRSNPDYVRFFRSTYVPEEMFFQTILLNATESERGKIHNHRLTFMQWDRPSGSYSSPISVDELPTMLTSGKLFARKFDAHQEGVVLDQLDQYLDQKRT